MTPFFAPAGRCLWDWRRSRVDRIVIAVGDGLAGDPQGALEAGEQIAVLRVGVLLDENLGCAQLALEHIETQILVYSVGVVGRLALGRLTVGAVPSWDRRTR